MSIFETLKFTDIDAGVIQSVDEMTVVPLISKDLGEVAEPLSLKFKKTNNYGSMLYQNTDKERSAIIPNNIMVRGLSAQDHAMAGSGVVLADKTKTFNNACCIESSQGGYLGEEGNDYDILPIELRKKLIPLKVRNEQSYDKLWGDISEWMSGTGVNEGRMRNAHLRYYYDNPQIKESLENFSAAFEPVDGQIGAIILFEDSIVGIEIMPTVSHWESYWKLLIRGCYGAELLRQKKLGIIKTSKIKMPEFEENQKFVQLEFVVNNFISDIRADILKKVESISVKNASKISTNKDFETILIETDSGGGDLITQDDTPVYLSLVV
jgi:hypothetical protein